MRVKQVKIIAYADDILLMVGTARPKTAFLRIERQLDLFNAWTKKFSLKFSASKSQFLSIKGGLKPGYTVGFGTTASAPRIESSSTATYLGVLLDPRRSYWENVLATSKKSNDKRYVQQFRGPIFGKLGS